MDKLLHDLVHRPDDLLTKSQSKTLNMLMFTDSTSEIADILNITENAVDLRVHRLREHLLALVAAV